MYLRSILIYKIDGAKNWLILSQLYIFYHEFVKLVKWMRLGIAFETKSVRHFPFPNSPRLGIRPRPTSAWLGLRPHNPSPFQLLCLVSWLMKWVGLVTATVNHHHRVKGYFEAIFSFLSTALTTEV